MEHVAVAAMGADRPGIVAAFTEALEGAGASIEDSSMTNLSGYFAMLLVVAGASPETVEQSLRPVADELDLMLEVHDGAEGAESSSHGEYVLAAYGPDRSGLVARLARVLADADANITDFGSRLGERGVFAMWFNVQLPAGADRASIEQQLRSAGSELGLDVVLHEADTTAM